MQSLVTTKTGTLEWNISTHTTAKLMIDFFSCILYYFILESSPTLPADAAFVVEPVPEAYAADCAIVLPLKHCAFSGCAWCGDDATSQAVHIVEHHHDLLKEGMGAHQNIKR